MGHVWTASIYTKSGDNTKVLKKDAQHQVKSSIYYSMQKNDEAPVQWISSLQQHCHQWMQNEYKGCMWMEVRWGVTKANKVGLLSLVLYILDY